MNTTDSRNAARGLTAPVVRLEGITKAFPGVIANDNISMDIYRGQVHCLLGENGAGKSTFISILAGMQQPDSGRIEVHGKPVQINSPKAAMDLGIGVVYQHSTLIPTLSVIENLMLGDSESFTLDRKGARARLEELTSTLGTSIDPNSMAGDLGLGQQQQVEIAKAMWKGSEVLILDEPTSMLTPQAIEDLETSVNRLKAEGLAVIFISHKLREAYAIGDCVTVLRGGKMGSFISPQEFAELDEQGAQRRILAAMFGEEIKSSQDHEVVAELAGAGTATKLRETKDFADAAVVLEVKNVSTSASGQEIPARDVSLTVRAGEIHGIAGIDGHGQSALAEAIAGERKSTVGSVFFDGEDITRQRVGQRQALGLRYVTDDRLHEGIVANLSVALNLVLKKIGQAPFWRFGQINRAAVQAEARERIKEFEIRTPSPDTRAGTLSGGNIQKVLLARELSHGPRAVVFHKPTYGLDLKTVYRVRDIVREFAEAGGAVLLMSTDLDELIELSDRISVISNGSLVGTVRNNTDDAIERVGELMTGLMAQGAEHVESH